MKTNAIVRIVIYSLVLLLLTGVLLGGIGIGSFTFQLGIGDGEYITGEGSVAAAEIENLEIDWASGNIRIVTDDTDRITFTEEGTATEEQRMTYTQSGSTLRISHSKPVIQIGFVSIPTKDLTITVPKDWECKELELDGASMDVSVAGLKIDKFEINGASINIDHTGSFRSLSCDGASCEMNMLCLDKPEKVDIDGASCSLTLTLPQDCGFQVEMDGLSCDFESDLAYTHENGSYVYGDRHCRIAADGLSCEIEIKKGQ